MSDLYTGLYQSGVGDKHKNSFNVQSEFIKVFPSSWRGAQFIAKTTEGTTQVVPDKKQFNPEASLNTEYNMTHTAGGIKTFIESITPGKVAVGDTSIEVYNLKFFINGYAFEIYNLNTDLYNNLGTKITEPLNLWASIRVGDLKIGSADLDDTKVLMPYYWTAINTPIPLDASLKDAYLIDADTEDTFATVKGELARTTTYRGVPLDTLSDGNDLYIFTGLVLTTSAPANNGENFQSIQLFSNGEPCFSNFWPHQVRGGRSDGKSTVIGDESLIAPAPDMLAVGRFNAATYDETPGSTVEQTLFAVGNGIDDATRQNAFEVSGYNTSTAFSQTVKFGPIEYTHSGTAKNIPTRGDVRGLRYINERTEVLENGSGIVINRPEGDVFIQETDPNAVGKIGIHSYGNVNILSKAENNGSKLQFKDLTWAQPDPAQPGYFDEKIISTFQTVEVATGLSNIIDPDARGLKMTNIHEINEEALVFKPCNAGETRNHLKSINHNSIGIDDNSDYEHSIEIGRTNTESAALTISGDHLILRSDGTNSFINKIRLADATVDEEVPKHGQSYMAGTDHLYNLSGIFAHNNKTDPAIFFTADNKIEVAVKDATDPIESLGKELRTLLVNTIYPIGSIYMSVENRTPADVLGVGTWERIAEGKMLISEGQGTDVLGNKERFTLSSNNTGTGYYRANLKEHNHVVNYDLQTEEVSSTSNTTAAITWNSATVTSAGSGAHTHIIDSEDNDNLSIHKHNIPVSLFDTYETTKITTKAAPNVGVSVSRNPLSWALGDGVRVNAGVTVYKDSDTVTDVKTAKLYTHPDGFASLENGSHSVLGFDYFTEYENMKTRNTWQARYKHLFEDRACLLIPTVRMGSYLSDYHCFTWNKPGPVYTGYQYVTTDGTAGKEIPSFEHWRWNFDRCFADWCTLAIEADNSDSSNKQHDNNTKRFVHDYQSTSSENTGDLTTNDLYPSYWYNDDGKENGDVTVDFNKPNTWKKRFEPGYMYSDHFNDYCYLNRLYVIDQIEKTAIKNGDTITGYSWLTDDIRSALELSDDAYWGKSETANQALEFAYLWYEFFKCEVSQQKFEDNDKTIILKHTRAWFFGIADDWGACLTDAARESLRLVARDNFNAMWTKQKSCGHGQTNAQDSDFGTTKVQPNHKFPSSSTNEAPYVYGLFAKPDDIKEQAIRDWLSEYARGTTNNGDGTIGGRDFTFRKDDGAHCHIINGVNNHTHNISTDSFGHKHGIKPIDITGSITTVNKSSNDTDLGNMPPYFVCYMWKRIS